jgi:hypothetical protein
MGVFNGIINTSFELRGTRVCVTLEFCCKHRDNVNLSYRLRHLQYGGVENGTDKTFIIITKYQLIFVHLLFKWTVFINQ